MSEIPVPPSPRDRRKHADGLKAAIADAATQADERRELLDVTVTNAEPGLYVQFDSQPDFHLELESLENKSKGIEVVAVLDVGKQQRATVFVPRGQVKYFVQRFEDYASKKTIGGEPKNKPLVESISGLRLATLRALWTDDPATFPKPGAPIWWEVWLRKHDGHERERLEEFSAKLHLKLGSRFLGFENRIVGLVFGTQEQLSTSLDILNDLAEVRRAIETAAVFLKMGTVEQAEWMHELKTRTTAPSPDAPAVCILDTGVNRGHPLLEGALAVDDMHAVEPDWQKADHEGHGTEMAGLALYGDLTPVLQSRDPVRLRHRLESVKILPPPNKPPTEPELYGSVVAQATSLAEVQSTGRRRCFSMAVTSLDPCDAGRPTSWSAAVDALAAGRSFDQTDEELIYLGDAEDNARRLFVLSAGNVGDIQKDHLTVSDNTAVFDPAQAWNALTVGACTALCQLEDEPGWKGWNPLAPTGELSPFSSTSVTFDSSWPIKPDVVLEGGNAAVSPSGKQVMTADSLSLLTTNHLPAEDLFTASSATSAAAAQAARMAAIISSSYPTYWPETIRALITHSAAWTPQMHSHVVKGGGVRAKLALLQRYGFGVADLNRALLSAKNALTLVVQDSIEPFAKGKYGQIHLHQLPWPKEVLADLGAITVRLRVTLSYFVEPNPSRLGWKRRYSYASHGLRFELISPTETVPSFRKRLNMHALEAAEKKPKTGDSKGWFFGAAAETKGSLHSNIWEGSAAKLAERGCLGIFPVAGWWKEQPQRDRSAFGARYALIVSIETDEQNVDVWTPVALQVGIPIPVET